MTITNSIFNALTYIQFINNLTLTVQKQYNKRNGEHNP